MRNLGKLGFWGVVLFLLVTWAATSWASTPPVDAGATKELLQFTSGGHVLGFSDSGLVVAGGSHAVKVDFVGAEKVTPETAGEIAQTGADKGAKPLTRVTYDNLWDNITLVYDQTESGLVESTYHIAPHSISESPVNQVRLQYNLPVDLDSNGNLVMSYEMGQMKESKPVAWQDIKGQRRFVPVDFRVIGDNEIGFSLGAYDNRYSLVIDPVMSWHTFLGSGLYDYAEGITIDSSGNLYVVGRSSATWGSPINPYSGDSDAFIAKLNSSGVLQWHTFLGSGVGDNATGITIDSSGNLYVAGYSFDTWGSPANVHSGGSMADAFVAKLNGSGVLQWNTFMGSDQHDWAYGITIDSSSNLYVTGHSNAAWGSPINAHSGSKDGFVAKLNSSGALQWNTFMGSSLGSDEANGITIDSSNNLYIVGRSDSTWGSPVNAHAGSLNYDGLVAKLNSSGVLQWHTFMGSAGEDKGYGITIDSSNNIYVAGYSSSTWGSPINPYSFSRDGFVAKLDSSGVLQWNTFMGSNAWDDAYDITIDSSNNLYVAGESGLSWGSPINPHSGSGDGFVAQLDSSGVLQWNTFMGSSASSDSVIGVTADSSNNLYVAGVSSATWGSPLNAYAGDNDAFVAKLVPTPPPAISSATYDGTSGVLVVTGTDIQANSIGSDIAASTFTLTGEGGSTYTLSDTPDVEITSATEFSLTLSATDKAAVDLLLDKDGTSSTGGTTYNLAAADDWDTNVTSGDTSDLTGNTITVSNVVVDTDGDGVTDSSDAFPNDVAASVDTDGDGSPDAWNAGKTEADSTTGLTLDAFPGDINEWADSDSDGVGDNSDLCPGFDDSLDSDNDTVPDDCDTHVLTLGASSAEAGLSCAQILSQNSSAPSGIYFLELDGSGGEDPVPVYCDMTTDGGGWMLGVNSLIGAEPTTTDMISNTGVAGLGQAHTRNLASWAIGTTAEIRHEIVDPVIGLTYNAKYTGAYHDPLPLLADWTTLGGHDIGADILLNSHFGMAWTKFDQDNDLWAMGNCATLIGVPWYYNNCWDTMPVDLSDGTGTGPVSIVSGSHVVDRYSIWVRELDTPTVADADSDGILDALDPCPNDSINNPDGDLFCAINDNCPLVSNDTQVDTDGDGFGDACDLCADNDDNLDADGDTIPDACDLCSNFDDKIDWDTDGIPDDCDLLVQVTVNASGDDHAVINNNGQIVWSGWAGSAFEAFKWDGVDIFQTTENCPHKPDPYINDNGLTVMATSIGGQVKTWDGTATTLIADNGNWPVIDNNDSVYWYLSDGNDSEIYRFNNSTISPITNNDEVDTDVDVSGNGYVVWTATGGTGAVTTDNEIFYWDGSSIVQLTDNSIDDTDPAINSKGQIVWVINDGDFEVLYWDGANTIQITSNAVHDYSPDINDSGNVVWSGSDGVDQEIYYWDGVNTVRITDNSVTDDNPSIGNDDFIAWESNLEILRAIVDTDNDGVGNHRDICPGYDDNVDLDDNDTPDGCDLIDSYQTSYPDYHDSTLIGNGGPDQLIIFGSTAKEKARAATFSNLFDGGGDSDDLIGFTGDDTYYFEKGDGMDALIDWGHGFSNNDEILFGPGIFPSHITFRVSGISSLHLVISYGTGDEIEVQNWFYDPNFLIEQIRFDDGTTWDTTVIMDSMILGTAADDVLDGWVADLTITGEAGNDTINSGPLNDIIDGGPGNDTITDENGDDVVTGGDGDDFITMRGWSDPTGGLPADSVDGGLGNDTIVISHMTNTTATGGDGIDHISVSWNLTTIDAVRAESHVNTLIGGAGDDTLMGYAGSDTYQLNLGDGIDVINDWDNGRNSVDRIVFGAGIAEPDNASVSLVNGNLVINYGGAGDQVVIENWEDPEYRIESFEFNGGATILTDTDMDNLLP